MKILIFMTAASVVLAARAAEAQSQEESSPVATSSSSVGASASTGDAAAVENTPGDAPKESVKPLGARPAEGAKETVETPAVLAGERLPPESGRPYYLRGTVQFRTLAVSDEDPANGRSMLYGLELGYRFDSKLSAFVRAGLTQRFVAPSSSTENLSPGSASLIDGQPEQQITSPFLLRDSTAGVVYRHGVTVAELPVSFAHYLNVYFPTSVSSQDRGLYLAPELATRGRVEVLEGLSVGVDLGLQYRFHKYAEEFGPNGRMLTQVQIASGLAADYNIFDLGEEWGRLDAGLGVSWAWQNTYTSRQGDDYWRQDYGWDVYAYYSPRAWLAVGLALEQGAPVLREGRVNPVLFHRDETELTFTVSATY